MIHRFLLCLFLFALAVSMVAIGQPTESNAGSSSERKSESWDWSGGSEESGGSSYLGVDIADVSAERLGELKLKEEHGAEVTMVDQDAPAGKAGLHEHDVIVSVNGTAIESAAQLRRMIVRNSIPGARGDPPASAADGQPLTIKAQLADRHQSRWPGSRRCHPCRRCRICPPCRISMCPCRCSWSTPHCAVA